MGYYLPSVNDSVNLGLPLDGLTGQLLAKASDTDFDLLWVDPPAGTGGGGNGTVTSVSLAAPAGFSVAGSPVNSSGTLALTFAAGYSLPTTASQDNWDTAFTERGYWDGGDTGLNAATGRTSLDLGGAAVLNVGTSAGTVAAGDDNRFTTDLSFDASTRLLSSSTGADVTLPLFASTTAGLAPLSGGGTTNFLRADGTWAAPPGGGSFPSPGFAPWSAGSGSMLAPNSCKGTLGATGATLNSVEYHQIFIPETVTISQLICRTNTTYAGTTDVRLGIYNNSGARPSTKIVDATLQITASGQATYAVSISQSLSPGWYWTSFLATALGTTPSFQSNPANSSGVGGGLFTEYTNAGGIVASVRQAGQTALPATASSLATSSAARPAAFLGV
jgi:hypothetical protein